MTLHKQNMQMICHSKIHSIFVSLSLLWRHNGHNGVSNNQPHDCLLHRLFRCRSKKTSKLCVTGLCAGNSPGTGEFPTQMARNAENISIWLCHHVLKHIVFQFLNSTWPHPTLIEHWTIILAQQSLLYRCMLLSSSAHKPLYLPSVP